MLTKNQKISGYELMDIHTKNVFFSFNENISKLERKKDESDGTFIHRIILKRDRYLKQLEGGSKNE